MRLTLRYLLAYMDEQLEPADAEELAAKLEKSEYAKSLLHRIRDVTRRLRLGAPRLDARGMGFDANTVAEYLDNALSDDRVPDFEKICLESDMHLAEVAACHQILSLVLGEPAQVDPASRKRMYALAASPPTRVDQPSPPPQPKAGKDRRTKGKRKKVKVPEYLKEPERAPTHRRLVGVVALLLLAAAVALAILGPGRMWRLASGRRAAPAGSASRQGGALPTTSEAPPQPPSELNKHAETQARRPAPLPGKRSKAKARSRPGSAQQNRPSRPSPAAADRHPEPSDEQAPQPPQPEQPDQDAGKMRSQPEDADAGKSPGETQGAASPAAAPPASQEHPAADNAAADRPADAEPPPDEDAAAGMNLGRLILEHDVLLRWQPPAADQAGGSWVRLPDRASGYAGDLLLTLPTYDPHLTLVGALTVQVLGGTRLELLPSDESGTAGIRLVSGRITVWSNARPGARLRVVAGDYPGTLVLDDPDATAGIEVQRVLRLGSDPRREPAPVVADLYANFGDISWQADDGQVTSLESGGHLPLDGRPLPPASPPPAAGREAPNAAQGQGMALPAWMTSTGLSPIDKRAAEIVEQHLARPERAVTLGLRELASDRRVEVRLLAMQCLAEIGEFDIFPGLFNDASQRAAWAKALDSLRAQLGLSPQTAVGISDAFARARGPRAEALFRMLCGYSGEQLEAGAAKELVDALEHEDLDARVLAYLNLREITGASLYYEPHGNPKKREQSVRMWRERLEKGEVVRRSAERS